MTLSDIPSGLWPHFKEYDVRTLNLDREVSLIIQRTLEYGTWDEVRWLFGTDPAGCSCIHYRPPPGSAGPDAGRAGGRPFHQGTERSSSLSSDFVGCGLDKKSKLVYYMPRFCEH